MKTAHYTCCNNSYKEKIGWHLAWLVLHPLWPTLSGTNINLQLRCAGALLPSLEISKQVHVLEDNVVVVSVQKLVKDNCTTLPHERKKPPTEEHRKNWSCTLFEFLLHFLCSTNNLCTLNPTNYILCICSLLSNGTNATSEETFHRWYIRFSIPCHNRCTLLFWIHMYASFSQPLPDWQPNPHSLIHLQTTKL